MTRKISIGLAFILASAALVGCGGNDKKTSGSGAAGGSTPKDAMLTMAKAAEEGNWKLFVDSFDIPDDDKDFMLKSFEAMSVMTEFEKKLKDTYSQEDIEAAGFNLNESDNHIPSAKDVEALEFKIEGDKATAKIKDGDTITFVQKGGLWFAAMEDENGPSPEEKEKALKMMEAVIAPAKAMLPKIGAEGYTAKKLKEEYDAEMAKAMMEMMSSTPNAD